MYLAGIFFLKQPEKQIEFVRIPAFRSCVRKRLSANFRYFFLSKIFFSEFFSYFFCAFPQSFFDVFSAQRKKLLIGNKIMFYLIPKHHTGPFKLKQLRSTVTIIPSVFRDRPRNSQKYIFPPPRRA